MTAQDVSRLDDVVAAASRDSTSLARLDAVVAAASRDSTYRTSARANEEEDITPAHSSHLVATSASVTGGGASVAPSVATASVHNLTVHHSESTSIMGNTGGGAILSPLSASVAASQSGIFASTPRPEPIPETSTTASGEMEMTRRSAVTTEKSTTFNEKSKSEDLTTDYTIGDTNTYDDYDTDFGTTHDDGTDRDDEESETGNNHKDSKGGNSWLNWSVGKTTPQRSSRSSGERSGERIRNRSREEYYDEEDTATNGSLVSGGSNTNSLHSENDTRTKGSTLSGTKGGYMREEDDEESGDVDEESGTLEEDDTLLSGTLSSGGDRETKATLGSISMSDTTTMREEMTRGRRGKGDDDTFQSSTNSTHGGRSAITGITGMFTKGDYVAHLLKETGGIGSGTFGQAPLMSYGNSYTDLEGARSDRMGGASRAFMNSPYDYYPVRQRYGYLSVLTAGIHLFLLVVSMTLCGVAPVDVNPLIGPYPDAFTELGGKNPYLTVVGNQWWRLITASYLNVGVVQLLVNVTVQLETGAFFEREWGSWRWFILYVVGGVGGSVAGCLLDPDTTSVTSSAAIMGLFGGKLSELLSQTFFEQDKRGLSGRRPDPGTEQVGGVLCWMAIVSLTGLAPYIDFSAHIGGVLTGFLVGMVLFSCNIRNPCFAIGWFLIGMTLLVVLSVPAILFLLYRTNPAEGMADPCEFYRNLFDEDYDCSCSMIFSSQY